MGHFDLIYCKLKFPLTITDNKENFKTTVMKLLQEQKVKNAFPNCVKHKWSKWIIFQWGYPALIALPYKDCYFRRTYSSIVSDNNAVIRWGSVQGRIK